MQIPFNKITNELIHSTDYREAIWVNNYEFHDTMEIIDMKRSGHSVLYILKSKTDNRIYPMFVKEMLNLIQIGIISKGTISGKWSFCKRGENYSLKFVGLKY